MNRVCHERAIGGRHLRQLSRYWLAANGRSLVSASRQARQPSRRRRRDPALRRLRDQLSERDGAREGGPAARASVLGDQLAEEAREAASAEVKVTRPVGDDADPRHPIVGFAAGLFEGGEILAL